MADRTRQQSTVYAPIQRIWDVLTGTPQHGYTSSPGYPEYTETPMGSLTKTTVDVVTPNFKKLIADGAIINNPFSSVEVEETFSPPGNLLILYRNTSGYTCSNGHSSQTEYLHHKKECYARPSLPSYLEESSAMVSAVSDITSLAVTDAHANVDVSEMLALATVAESGKSVQSMMSIYGRLRKILKLAKRLRFSELSNELSPKELANRWMEVRYAIRPLIYDAYGVANALQKNRGYARRTFRGSAENSMSINDTVSRVKISAYTYHDVNRTTTLDVSARAGVLCDVSINDLTVFGVDQLLETAWELCPLSFIVDWFANVGDWIAAHTPNAGVRQRASWVTTKKVLTQRTTGAASYYDFTGVGRTGVSLSIPNSWSQRKETSLTRSIDPQLSTFPSVDVRLDGFKLTDMGIILRNYLK